MYAFSIDHDGKPTQLDHADAPGDTEWHTFLDVGKIGL